MKPMLTYSQAYLRPLARCVFLILLRRWSEPLTVQDIIKDLAKMGFVGIRAVAVNNVLRELRDSLTEEDDE